jgi:hypothetical protein
VLAKIYGKLIWFLFKRSNYYKGNTQIDIWEEWAVI